MAKNYALKSFVVRFWLEPNSSGDPVWHGHVRHVQSKQETYLQDMAELSNFLERVSGVPGPGLASPPDRKIRVVTEDGTRKPDSIT